MTFDSRGIGCGRLHSENQGVWQSGPYLNFESGVDPSLDAGLYQDRSAYMVWLKVDPRLYVLCFGEERQTREGMAPILWKSHFF